MQYQSLPTIAPVLLTAVQGVDVCPAGFLQPPPGALTVMGTLVSDVFLAVADPRIRSIGR